MTSFKLYHLIDMNEALIGQCLVIHFLHEYEHLALVPLTFIISFTVTRRLAIAMRETNGTFRVWVFELICVFFMFLALTRGMWRLDFRFLLANSFYAFDLMRLVSQGPLEINIVLLTIAIAAKALIWVMLSWKLLFRSLRLQVSLMVTYLSTIVHGLVIICLILNDESFKLYRTRT